MGEAGSPNTFITLTVNPNLYMSPSARAQELAHAWRRVRRRAMKVFDLKALPFLAVFEQTKRGEPHLHILCRVRWIPQTWLSEQMNAEIGAPIVDIRRVQDGAEAIRYVAKYIGKQPHRFDGVKRYWRSQDFVVIEKKENEGDRCIIRWNWTKWTADFLAEELEEEGFVGAWLTPSRWIGFRGPPGGATAREEILRVASRHRPAGPQEGSPRR